MAHISITKHMSIKPLFNISFKERLITVPSCDEHNMTKSNLDEYLTVTLSGKVGNNSLAYVQTWNTLNENLLTKTE